MNGRYEGIHIGESHTSRSTSVSHSQSHFPNCMTFTHGGSGSISGSSLGWYKIVIDLKQLNASTDAYSQFATKFPVGGKILAVSFGLVFNSSYRWYFSFSFNPSDNNGIKAESIYMASNTYDDAPDSGFKQMSTTVVSDASTSEYFHFDSSTLIMTYHDYYNPNTSSSLVTQAVQNYSNHRLCKFDSMWYQFIT